MPGGPGKQGTENSLLVAGARTPFGCAVVGANRHDSPVGLRPRLEKLGRFGSDLSVGITVSPGPPTAGIAGYTANPGPSRRDFLSLIPVSFSARTAEQGGVVDFSGGIFQQEKERGRASYFPHLSWFLSEKFPWKSQSERDGTTPAPHVIWTTPCAVM